MDYKMFMEELTGIMNLVTRLHYNMGTDVPIPAAKLLTLYEDPEKARDVRSTLRLIEGRMHALGEAIKVSTPPDEGDR